MLTKQELLTKIQSHFPDAILNYVADKYDFPNEPAMCFIPSRNLYIEYFPERPQFWVEDFDAELHPDGDELVTQSDEFMNFMMCQTSIKNKDVDKDFEASIQSEIDRWLIYRENKRKAAKENSLNYVVFWDEKLEDAELWFAMGCPDGHDYDYEYSWLPQKDLLEYPLVKITGRPGNLSKIVKHFQFFEFFWRELAIWYNNDTFRNRGKLQAYLYANRYKYINKMPDELTTPEILRGLTISGVLKGYTVFDSKLMQEVINKYHPTSIYDPCAGWGERMLTAFINNVRYVGVDVNDGLIPGYVNMMNFYNMKNCFFIHGDSSEYDIEDGHDMVITCPPYGNIEYYSDYGAENLKDEDFHIWWGKVVEKIAKKKIKYFCFQINTKYRDGMLKIVENAGYKLIDELYFSTNKSSHFNRKKNGVNLKTEKESMLVLEII